MHADEQVGLGLIGETGPSLQFDLAVVGAGEEHLVATSLEQLLEAQNHVERQVLLVQMQHAVLEAGIIAAVAGVEHDESGRSRQLARMFGGPEQRRDRLDHVDLANPEAALVGRGRGTHEDAHAVQEKVVPPVLEPQSPASLRVGQLQDPAA